ncbi:uncharacterized protein LOC142634167 [Castanea sativa]|uniref:uncharacterized protein LOC142634167 n=1 Tax=Castanea sativa TaxID=21020 RepID=UPI003F64B174
MRMALDAKSKLGFVDSSINASMAVTPLEKQAWSKCNSMISSWILNSVSPHITFLNGLNESYSQVKTQILMMEPIPSIDKAFSLAIREERKRSLGFNVTPSVESTALAIKNQAFNQGSSSSSSNDKNFKGNAGKGTPVCSHCGKVGHIMEKCYKLVGIPPSYNQKEELLWLIKSWLMVIKLIVKRWVLDTRATDHIVRSVTLFTKITSSVSTFVQLPNGERDLSCWRIIGVGKLHNNLYLLQSSASFKSVSVVSSILGSVFSSFVNSVSDVLVITKPYLWHLRLGHVSDTKLHVLHDCLPDVINVHSNKDCALCPIAKQKRLPFPFFNHLSYNAFDLIHCDVWGPFAKFTHDGFGSKFDPRSIPCVFLGYPFGVKGYKLLNLATKKIFVSRDVLFHEIVFPFISSTYSSSPHSTITLPHLFSFLDTSTNSLLSASQPAYPSSTTPHTSNPTHDSDILPSLPDSDLPIPNSNPLSSSSLPSPNESISILIIPIMRSSLVLPQPSQFDHSHHATKSVKDPKWQDAMAAEIAALESNQT